MKTPHSIRERRRLMNARTCYVCGEPIPMSKGVYFASLSILYHADGDCAAAVDHACERDCTHSRRGRLRADSDILRRIKRRTP